MKSAYFHGVRLAKFELLFSSAFGLNFYFIILPKNTSFASLTALLRPRNINYVKNSQFC